MKLSEKQQQFTAMLGKLIVFATEQGLGLTLGRGWVSTVENARVGGHKNSLHLRKLAQDFNLFDAEGRYLTRTEDHAVLGEYWKSIGGTWGGDFGDGNHYSLEHEGMR